MDPKSPAAKQGIRQGQVITTVAGKPVADIKSLQGGFLNDTPADQCALGTNETEERGRDGTEVTERLKVKRS